MTDSGIDSQNMSSEENITSVENVESSEGGNLSAAKKVENKPRAPKICPLCGAIIIQLKRHFTGVHNLSDRDAAVLSSQGVTAKTDKKECPTCGKFVTELGHHLIRTHHMSTTDPEYFRMTRRQSRPRTLTQEEVDVETERAQGQDEEEEDDESEKPKLHGRRNKGLAAGPVLETLELFFQHLQRVDRKGLSLKNAKQHRNQVENIWLNYAGEPSIDNWSNPITYESQGKMEKKNIQLPQEILAFRLLKRANITPEERLLVLTGMDYNKIDKLYEDAKQSLRKFKGDTCPGQTRQSNPIGHNGKIMTCKSCGSFRHLIAQCPDSWENLARVNVTNEENVVLWTGNKAENVAKLGVEAQNSVVLESACSSTVCGKTWFDNYVNSLDTGEKSKVVKANGSKIFKFGGGTCLKSLAMYTIQATLAGHDVLIKTDVVESDIPLLLSRKAMKSAQECDLCKQYVKTPPRPVVSMPMASRFNEKVAMDLKLWWGLWILHIIDIWSRYTVSLFIARKRPCDVIDGLMGRWVAVFGVKGGIMTDNGALDGLTSSERFAEHLNALHSARRAFIETEADERIPRALRNKVRESEQVFVNGDQVYYKREGKDRWLGPGSVVFQDGKVVFVRHGGVFIRTSPNRLIKKNSGIAIKSDTNLNIESATDTTKQDINEIRLDISAPQDNVQCVPSETLAKNDGLSSGCGNDAIGVNHKNLRPDDVIEYKIDDSPDWIQATVLNRAGKATGSYRNKYNVRVEESGEKMSINLDQVIWKRSNENVNVVMESLRLKEVKTIRWCAGDQQLANSMTKQGASGSSLLKVLNSGMMPSDMF
ncbi:hypothetical protein LOTGIDRAFT_175654 [Lottia gigantea]|uniref:Integrase catalytic domain-containing protein n=1 Tax=Lottia gigantea TaxID=225164 RepID=V3ZMV6_LOTGI|nr:hypothetical protein LOTGIDRAFT_175654 [Lottia gigantea]ESO92708.1 hypothetical protein LOTGIDRAFT_175654 [Lottia gigantea]